MCESYFYSTVSPDHDYRRVEWALTKRGGGGYDVASIPQALVSYMGTNKTFISKGGPCMKQEPGVYPRLNLEKQKEWTTEKKKIPKVYVCFVIAVCYIHFLNNPPS